MRYIVLYLLQLETKAFSLLKRPRSAFTFKNLLRHYAKQAPKRRRGALLGAFFFVIVKSDGSFTALFKTIVQNF